MIYFFQRADHRIIIDTATNIDQAKQLLKEKFGSIELLGVKAGGNNDVKELFQRFASDTVEGEVGWFNDSQALLDYIDEHGTLDVNAVKPSARYKSSEYTPIKQQSLSDALQQQFQLILQITQTWRHVKPYLYFDLNAGPGISNDGQPGSPVIFKRAVAEAQKEMRKLHFEAYLYESDPITHTRLTEIMADDVRFSLINGSHELLFTEMKKHQAKSEKERNWVFGTVYADPSNATLPWELLELMNDVYPHIDVMLNIACASYKRTIANAGYQTLAERLPRIKKHWIVRKPFGKHQWSILLGTNWEDYPAWKKKGFFPWNDNDMGSSIFDKLVLTPKQLRQRDQASFLDDLE